jgi:putative restriction endonuclease
LSAAVRIPLINPQRGIFKPRQMAGLLLIRTVFPRRGGRVWYDDQREAHRQIYAGDDAVDYAFDRLIATGRSAEKIDNGDLMLHRVPEPAVIRRVWVGAHDIPTFVLGWHPKRLHARLAFGALAGASAQAMPPDAPERRYALREVKARLHQGSFRDAVLAAYGDRCAISRLPEPRLLDAAHIVVDADEQLGQPIVPNGLPLTKIHHAAFDAHLIGIDPDFGIHVSDWLLEIRDGPFLELGLKGIVGQAIQLPRRRQDRPDRNRLAVRFEQFKKAA